MELTPTQTDYSPLHDKIGLVDGDIIAYRTATIAEQNKYLAERLKEGSSEYNHFDGFDSAKEWAGDEGLIWKRTVDLGLEIALEACDNVIGGLKTTTKASSLEFFLSGRDNFRYRIAVTKPYKGNRDYAPKPKYLRQVREHLIKNYGAKVSDGIEADDAIGIRSSEVSANGFIASIDKDLDQLVGWHYNWVKDKVYYVTAKEADFMLYSQILSGDATDNIPGLPSIGKRNAERILEGSKSSRELFNRAYRAYRDAGKDILYMMEQANLVYIRNGKNDKWQVPTDWVETEARKFDKEGPSGQTDVAQAS